MDNEFFVLKYHLLYLSIILLMLSLVAYYKYINLFYYMILII